MTNSHFRRTTQHYRSAIKKNLKIINDLLKGGVVGAAAISNIGYYFSHKFATEIPQWVAFAGAALGILLIGTLIVLQVIDSDDTED